MKWINVENVQLKPEKSEKGGAKQTKKVTNMVDINPTKIIIT